MDCTDCHVPEPEGSPYHEVHDVEVMWSLSGERVCFVQATAETLVDEVKAQISAHTGIPVSEQRLFVGDAVDSGPGAAGSLRLFHALAPTKVAAALAWGSSTLPLVEGSAGQPRPAPATPAVPAVRLLRCVSDPRHTDLSCLGRRARIDALSRGEFTRIRQIANALHGMVLLYRWSRPGEEEQLVAVKQMPNVKVDQNRNKETDEWAAHLDARKAPTTEDPLTEIGVLSFLSQQPDMPLYLLRMLGAFQDSHTTWLVSEFAEGGELFALVARGGCQCESQARKYMWQLLVAVRYLHSHHIAHRDISLENVVLSQDTVRLMDFGMAVPTHSETGDLLRYFRPAGKDTYRAPECYVPSVGRGQVHVVAPADARPGDVAMLSPSGNGLTGMLCEVRLPQDVQPGRQCLADLWGYAAPPADVFALGVCLFSMVWQVAPWQRAVLLDPYFAFVHRHGDQGIAQLLRSWQKQLLPPEGMSMVSKMLLTDPAKRANLDECLKSQWFAGLADEPIPVHTQA